MTEHSKALEEEAQELATANEVLDGELQSLRIRVQEESQSAKAAQESARAAAQQFAEAQSVLEENNQQLAEQRRLDVAQKDEIARLRRLLEESACDARDLTKALAEIHASQSWQITQPLRTVYDVFRSLRRRRS